MGQVSGYRRRAAPCRASPAAAGRVARERLAASAGMSAAWRPPAPQPLARSSGRVRYERRAGDAAQALEAAP